jgi:meso-butanediol dehydrogenase/(S,S)-butanediol dehydrogenase/diacetyl reductase
MQLEGLKDKVAIVTGAAGGIGLACAQRLLKEGARVVLADRDNARLKQAYDDLLNSGVRHVLSSHCDVGVEADVTATVDLAISEWGQLDIVVNNAGLMLFKPIEELNEEDWLRVLQVDLIGAFFFTKQAFLKMRQGGAIVNVASVHALETSALVSTYAASKAALLSLTRSSAIEGKPKGIRVNAILPGAVDTPMLWSNPNVKSGAEKVRPQDVGTVEDIAASIVYLASDDARFVQGAALRVDGGRLITL